jgi:hypothetical protein
MYEETKISFFTLETLVTVYALDTSSDPYMLSQWYKNGALVYKPVILNKHNIHQQ